ncbi:MAG: GntR family transcriptional regulator [Butyrivibrio sp.]|nr:GntR family transcriptional regulator [Butyrivibrio sp.]
MISEIQFIDNGDGLSLRDMVYASIKKAIMNGTLAPGDRIMEIPISKQMGVSRTPVRDAIKCLEKEKLVTIKAGCGARVASISEVDVLSTLSVRVTLEEMSVRLACENINEVGIAKLRKIHEELSTAVNNDDVIAIHDRDSCFHKTLSEIGGNGVLTHVIEFLENEIIRYRVEYLKNTDARYVILEEHRALIDALENRDVDLCVAIITDHINKQKKHLIK